MNNRVGVVVEISKLLRNYDKEVHVIVNDDRITPDDVIGVIPFCNSDDKTVRLSDGYEYVLVSDIVKKHRSFSAGLTIMESYGGDGTTQCFEKKLYTSETLPITEHTHPRIYQTRTDTIRNVINLCKMKFNTDTFIYVINVSSIDNNEEVLNKFKCLMGII